MLKLGVEFESRDFDKQPLTEGELEALIGDSDYKRFLNTRNKLYRARNWKDHPPTRGEAIRLMANEPNLIRRPIAIRGKQMILGYDEPAYRKLGRDT